MERSRIGWSTSDDAPAGSPLARLVKHELVLCIVDFEMWVNDGRDPPKAPIATPMSDEHKHTLARVLATPEWDMIAGTHQWIDLYSDDPLYDREWWSEALSEMNGGPEALRDYLDGHSERKLRKLRQIGWEERREQQRISTATASE